ncbi:uncharacterized protein LOC126997574 [Eriocheir sinensis]|uniref:uncharacterized protein LOC126997574 n=1 Tax=Eriocheir sinensis TaxID=95602 RepID=UPI0021CA5D84|nr:uncharacterized protein LOC126997574 [Eriocheir sinensis]
MKILWLSLLLAGLCLAKEKEATDDLQEVEGRRLQRAGGETLCSGCSSGGDKTSSSSVVVPNIHLPNILGDKTDLIHQALGTANDYVGHVEDPASDLLLKIGDLISFFGSASSGTSSLKPGLDLSGNHGLDTIDLGSSLGGLTGGLAAVESLGSLISIFQTLKAKLLHTISAGLQIANIILAIIGLAMIIGYVVENDGKLGVLSFGLTGEDSETDTGYGSSSGSGGYARSLSESPVVQGLTNLVYDAISKYD